MALSDEELRSLAAKYGGQVSESVAQSEAAPEPQTAASVSPETQAAPSIADVVGMAAQYGGQVQQSDVPQLDASGKLIQTQQAMPEPTLGEKLLGALEAGGTFATGATTGMMGGARGLAEGLMERIMSDKIGAYEGAQLMGQRMAEEMARATYQPKTRMGQEYVQGMSETLGAIPPVVPMAPELMAATRMAAPVTQRVGAGIQAADRAAEQAIPEAAGKAAATIADIAMPERRAEIARVLREEPDNTDVVRYRLVDDQVRPDKDADSVLKQGWKEGVLANVKSASDEDRQKMQQMLNIHKLGKKSEKFRAINRPADILGKSVDERVKFIDNTRKQAGQEIEKVANEQLKGQPVNYQPAIGQFLSDLNALGVKVEMGEDGIARAILKDSDIQGDKQAQRLLNTVLERFSDVKAPDAYGVHSAKRFIDTQVSYGKKNLANPLTQQAERAVKDLRRNLNQALSEQFPEYGAANTKYSESKTALDNLQKAVGTQLDFDSPNAPSAFGTAMRRILSNYGSRVNVIDSLDDAERVAGKYGMPIKDNLMNQVIFANEIDRMFGAPAATSFKGQISDALRTGVDIARGGVAQKAMDLATAGLERVKGINEENAIKEMEKILSRRTEKPKASPSTTLQPINQ